MSVTERRGEGAAPSERHIVLRQERDGPDSRHMSVRLESCGDLVIEGQDLGPKVADFWGVGYEEYEFAVVVPAAYMQRLADVLGCLVHDILDCLVARYRGGASPRLTTDILAAGVEARFWSRVGT